MGGLGICPCCKSVKSLTVHHDKEIGEKIMICDTCHKILEEYLKARDKYSKMKP